MSRFVRITGASGVPRWVNVEMIGMVTRITTGVCRISMAGMGEDGWFDVALSLDEVARLLEDNDVPTPC